MDIIDQVNKGDTEWSILEAAARSYGRRIHNVNAGSCFYHAISYALTGDENLMSDHLRERNCNLMMTISEDDGAALITLDNIMVEKHRSKAADHVEAEDCWIRCMSDELKTNMMIVLQNHSTFHQIFSVDPIVPGPKPPLIVLGLHMTSGHFVVSEGCPGKGNRLSTAPFVGLSAASTTTIHLGSSNAQDVPGGIDERRTW